MLTGRESLIRLIGKRRRYLPNSESILSYPIQSILSKNGNDEPESIRGTVDHKIEGSDVQVSDCDWVTCPVCGNKVRGEDNLINSHLDTCLARGTKRKLSQRTLLQLNFSTKPKVEIQSTESQYVDTSITECKFPLKETFLTDSSGDCSTQNLECNMTDNYSVYSPLLLCEKEVVKNDTDKSVEDICGRLLETYIVGRKFCEVVEICLGQSISLMRDPDNPKDTKAVKVLSADSAKVLGFLPRELAQYISPLMDKFDLKFEGNISCVPDSAFAVVPVQIVCQDKIAIGERECEELQVFKSMWKQVINVVESMKTCSPSMAKYQQNFTLLIQEFMRTSFYLLTDDEKSFLETFLSLSDDSQRLFVRLYTRKGPWFRMSNISYTEISDCQQASERLSAAGYACFVQYTKELHKDDLKEILNLLTVGELREVYCMIRKKRICGSRKQDFTASIFSLYENGSCPILPSLILEKIGPFIRISSKAESLVWRAERLFFLNGEQDLSSFLLVDLGIVKYPTYNCIISEQIFSCRNDLLLYEEAIEVAQIMDQSLDENNAEMVWRCIEISNSRISSSSTKTTAESSKPGPMSSFFSCFSASWVYSKVVLLGVSFHEHENRYDDAINLLKRLLLNFTSDRRRGYWTLRLSVDLEHVGRINESLLVAENGLLDPCVRAGSRVSLQRRVLRLGKPPRRWKIPNFSKSVERKITEVQVQGRPLNSSTGMKSRFYGEDGEQCGVEELALQYYAGEGGGWQGVHTESGIWLTIFGLLMWDIIFADVPDVFRTRFQTSPLDLETDSFYEVRKSIIEPLLEKIHQGMAEEILITSWESHQGTACRGVNWDKHSLTTLRAIVSCVGGPCLALICHHLAQDYRSWSSGMPDLLLWRFHGDYSGEAKLVEVKGPKDRLSEQQRAWLIFLMDSGFNAEVCRVSPAVV